MTDTLNVTYTVTAVRADKETLDLTLSMAEVMKFAETHPGALPPQNEQELAQRMVREGLLFLGRTMSDSDWELLYDYVLHVGSDTIGDKRGPHLTLERTVN